jgi:hypothetical protein
MTDKGKARLQDEVLSAIVDDKFTPKGNVKIQFMNERGKVVDQEERSNYIGPIWKRWALARLRLPWTAFGHNWSYAGTFTGGTAVPETYPFSRGTVPRLPISALGCWNDTAAEDPVGGHTIYLPANATGMVAWASRWPFASPTGARGSVNVTDSNQDEDTVRFVFDWTTSQGNGTFQSVGWFEPGAPGIPAQYAGISHRGRLVSQNYTSSTFITGATGLYVGGGYYHPADGKWYFVVRRQATSGAMRVLSVSFSSLLDDSLVNIMGVSPTVSSATINIESQEFTPTSVITSAANDVSVIGRDSSSNTVFVYRTSAGGVWRWGIIPFSGLNTSYAHPSGTTSGNVAGCVIGTTAYMSDGTASSTIHTATTTTGATIGTITIDANVTALCTLAGITTPRVHDMCTDGTSLYVVYGNSTTSAASKWLCVRLNTSGVLQEIIGSLPKYLASTPSTEASGAPYAGTYVYPSSSWASFTEYLLSPDGAAATNTTEDLLSGNTVANDASVWSTGDPINGLPSAQQLVYADGGLYLVGTGANNAVNTTSNLVWGAHRIGYNLGSRVLLASPRTKTGTQTMKITYDVTIPGWT